MTGFDLLQQFGEPRPVEVRPGVPIVREMPDIAKAMLTGVCLQVLFLIGYGVTLGLGFIIA